MKRSGTDSAVSATMGPVYDVTLFVEEKSIEAHQEVLRKASGYFARAFDRFKSKGKNLVLPVTTVSYEDLLDVIKFIYTDSISEERRRSPQFKKALIDLEVDLEVRIFVKMLTGNLSAFMVSLEDKVISLKKKIYCEGGPQPEYQRLVFCGKSMENDQTLEACRIVEDATIYLVRRIGRYRVPEN